MDCPFDDFGSALPKQRKIRNAKDECERCQEVFGSKGTMDCSKCKVQIALDKAWMERGQKDLTEVSNMIKGMMRDGHERYMEHVLNFHAGSDE